MDTNWKKIWTTIKDWTIRKRVVKKCCRRLKRLEDKTRTKENALRYGFGLKDNIKNIPLKVWRDDILPEMSLIHNRRSTEFYMDLMATHLKDNRIDRRTEAIVLKTLRRLQRERSFLERKTEWQTRMKTLLVFSSQFKTSLLAMDSILTLDLIIALDLLFGIDCELTTNFVFFDSLDNGFDLVDERMTPSMDAMSDSTHHNTGKTFEDKAVQ